MVCGSAEIEQVDGVYRARQPQQRAESDAQQPADGTDPCRSAGIHRRLEGLRLVLGSAEIAAPGN